MKKLLLLILIFGCSTEPEGINSSFNVRILNSMPEPINVVISLSDYGLIAPNDKTIYKPILMGENEVYLNDSLFTFDLTGTYDPPPPIKCEEYYLVEFYEATFGENTYTNYHSTVESSNFDEWWGF